MKNQVFFVYNIGIWKQTSFVAFPPSFLQTLPVCGALSHCLGWTTAVPGTQPGMQHSQGFEEELAANTKLHLGLGVRLPLNWLFLTHR